MKFSPTNVNNSDAVTVHRYGNYRTFYLALILSYLCTQDNCLSEIPPYGEIQDRHLSYTLLPHLMYDKASTGIAPYDTQYIQVILDTVNAPL